MRRLFVTILILLFSLQVKAECVDELDIQPLHSLLIEAQIQAAADAASSEQSAPKPFDPSSGQVPHADFSDSVQSHVPLAHYRFARGAWRGGLRPSFPTLYHPLFKPPPI